MFFCSVASFIGMNFQPCENPSEFEGNHSCFSGISIAPADVVRYRKMKLYKKKLFE